jgi:hypothetical protein
MSNISDLRPATMAELLVPALVEQNVRLRSALDRERGYTQRLEIELHNFLTQYFGNLAEDMLNEIEERT